MLSYGQNLAAAAPSGGDLEAKIKAAYLYHLIKFVEWPELPTDYFRICVSKSEQVGELLNELSNRTARDLPLKIEQSGDFTRCQILFIGRAETNTADVLARVRHGKVLTVSDQGNFARRGGIVGFYSESGKIKLEINTDAARAANLRVSAKLMELARNVPSARE